MMKHHVQNHVIVSRVVLMLMRVPIRRALMDLYIACPYRIAEFQFRVEEVGAGVLIMRSGIDQFKRYPVCRA